MPFRILVVLCGAITGAIGAVVYPYLGLLGLVFLTFGRPQDDRPNVVDLHIPLMFAAAISLGVMLRIVKTGPAIIAAVKRLWILFIFYALMAASAWNNWTRLSQNRLDDFTTLIFLSVLTLTLVTTEERLRGYIAMILASGAFLIIRVLRNPGLMIERIGGEKFERFEMGKKLMFGGANYLALTTALVMLLSIILLTVHRSLWQRIALVVLTGAAAYTFFRANSRGASIGFAIGLVALWLMQRRKLKAFVVVIVLACVGFLLAPQSYWDRLQTVTHYEDDTSATARLQLWDTALSLIPQYPMLGVGPDNFIFYAPNTPHDAYLQVGCEIGLPALVVYIMFLAAGLYSAFRAWRISGKATQGKSYIFAASQGVFCCILAVVAQGFTTGLAHREIVYVFVTLAICLKACAETLQSAPASAEPARGAATLFAADSDDGKVESISGLARMNSCKMNSEDS